MEEALNSTTLCPPLTISHQYTLLWTPCPLLCDFFIYCLFSLQKNQNQIYCQLDSHIKLICVGVIDAQTMKLVLRSITFKMVSFVLLLFSMGVHMAAHAFGACPKWTISYICIIINTWLTPKFGVQNAPYLPFPSHNVGLHLSQHTEPKHYNEQENNKNIRPTNHHIDMISYSNGVPPNYLSETI